MVAMNVDELIEVCAAELADRGYAPRYQRFMHNAWLSVSEWCRANGISEFTEVEYPRYIAEMVDPERVRIPSSKHYQRLRGARMLVSYRETGDFELHRTKPKGEFSGSLAGIAEEYCLYAKQTLSLSQSTIKGSRLHLLRFLDFIENHSFRIDELGREEFEQFFAEKEKSISMRLDASKTLRHFLRFLFERGLTGSDRSIHVPSTCCRKNCKLPTTYTEEEIKALLSSVDRASARGKRDYLILLLAAEYGWRAGDIVGFKFTHIDWEKNVIRFNQQKTGVPVEFPLTASVGNAIISYLRDGRPKSETQEIIVCHATPRSGKQMSAINVNSVVAKYMNRAGIKDWKSKKHGPHALRHSAATNMLAREIPIHVVSQILGHQSVETTRNYIRVSVSQLAGCALPPPACCSSFFRWKGGDLQ